MKVLRFTIWLYLIYIVPFSLVGQTLSIGIHGDGNTTHTMTSLPSTSAGLGHLNVEDRQKLPRRIQYLKKNDSSLEKQKIDHEIIPCERELLSALVELQKEGEMNGQSTQDLKSWWQTENPACFGVYQKLAPKIWISLKGGDISNDQDRLFKTVYAEKLFVKAYQSSGDVPRYAAPDLLLDPDLVTDTVFPGGNTSNWNPTTGELWLSIWSSHYLKLPPGRVPQRATYLLRIGLEFMEEGKEVVFWTEWFQIDV